MNLERYTHVVEVSFVKIDLNGMTGQTVFTATQMTQMLEKVSSKLRHHCKHLRFNRKTIKAELKTCFATAATFVAQL